VPRRPSRREGTNLCATPLSTLRKRREVIDAKGRSESGTSEVRGECKGLGLARGDQWVRCSIWGRRIKPGWMPLPADRGELRTRPRLHVARQPVRARCPRSTRGGGGGGRIATSGDPSSRRLAKKHSPACRRPTQRRARIPPRRGGSSGYSNRPRSRIRKSWSERSAFASSVASDWNRSMSGAGASTARRPSTSNLLARMPLRSAVVLRA